MSRTGGRAVPPVGAQSQNLDSPKGLCHRWELQSQNLDSPKGLCHLSELAVIKGCATIRACSHKGLCHYPSGNRKACTTYFRAAVSFLFPSWSLFWWHRALALSP